MARQIETVQKQLSSPVEDLDAFKLRWYRSCCSLALEHCVVAFEVVLEDLYLIGIQGSIGLDG